MQLDAKLFALLLSAYRIGTISAEPYCFGKRDEMEVIKLIALERLRNMSLLIFERYETGDIERYIYRVTDLGRTSCKRIID